MRVKPAPLDELILTILSQNTNDRNRDRAFSLLKSSFPTWAAVAHAPLPSLEQAIRPAGLAPTKAPRIQKVLKSVREHFGDYFLPSSLDAGELFSFLVALPGVGPKTARCVLLFSLEEPFFPVDTHIYRVGKRLGLIGERETREQAMERLDRSVPLGLHRPLHLLLIEHGRHSCRPQPRCQLCPLPAVCLYQRKQS